MSDTPRTDKSVRMRAFKAAFLPPEAIVTADFARELERELAKANAERDEARREACCDALYVRAGIYTAKEAAARRGWDCFDKKEVQS
jgi:hypothetical protein